MAHRIVLVDDITGEDADRTTRLGWEGVTYELDLTTANHDKLAAALDPWLRKARKAGKAGSQPTASAAQSGRKNRRTVPTPELKARAVALAESGMPSVDICRQLNLSPTTLRKWRREADSAKETASTSSDTAAPAAPAAPVAAAPAPTTGVRRMSTIHRKPPSAATTREQRAHIREWARKHGWKIGDKGRISEEIMADYNARAGRPGKPAPATFSAAAG